MTDRVYGTFHLVLRLNLSSDCCRRSFTKAPEDSLSFWINICFLSQWNFPGSVSVPLWLTVGNNWSWKLLPLFDHTTEALHRMACSGPAASQGPGDNRFHVHARTHADSKWGEAVRLEDALSPLVAHHHFALNIPLKHPLLVFSCFLNLPSLPFLGI